LFYIHVATMNKLLFSPHTVAGMIVNIATLPDSSGLDGKFIDSAGHLNPSVKNTWPADNNIIAARNLRRGTSCNNAPATPINKQPIKINITSLQSVL
jgi:hypothetical protein